MSETEKRIEYYPNGKKQVEETYKDGKLNGLCTGWYETGEKQYESHWKDGKEDGLWTWYEINGQKYWESTYKDGVKISVKSWDEDGNEFDENKRELTNEAPLAQIMRQSFFNGEVHLLKQGLFRAKYSVKDSNCLIKVKNNTHVRCLNQFESVENSGSLPTYFEILAPMSAVNIISGELPNECLKEMDDSEYLATRLRWDGF